MLSPLETLLEAARFIELQEQQQQQQPPPPPPLQQQQQQQPQRFIAFPLPLTTNSQQLSNTTTISVVGGGRSSNGGITNPLRFTTNSLHPSITSASITASDQSNSHHQHHRQLLEQTGNFPTIVRIDEPRVNGHNNTTAPPLVVISPSPNNTINSVTSHLQQHHNTPPLATIDLSSVSQRNNSTIGATIITNSSGGNTTTLSSVSQQLLHQQIVSSQQHDEHLNLSSGSSSGYMSCSNNSSFNSTLHNTSIGAGPVVTAVTASTAPVNISSNSLNLSCTNITNSSLAPTTTTLQQPLNGLISIAAVDHLGLQPQPAATTNRRRTTSTNSNGAGTREVHNKLEKNRRAHLKECFETLKKQLPTMPEEKKTSNLSILGAAIRHIQVLKRKERELEYEMERLAKEKITAQNRILFLKRELASFDIDCTKLTPEAGGIGSGGNGGNSGIIDSHIIKAEREQLTEPSQLLASGRNGIRYSSSSSLSSVATIASSSSNNSNSIIQLQTINNLSPVILQQQQQALKTSPHHNIQPLYVGGASANVGGNNSQSNSSNLTNISTASTTMFPLSLATSKNTTTITNLERNTPPHQTINGPPTATALKLTPNGLISSANNQSISYFTTSTVMASTAGTLTNGIPTTTMSAFNLRPTITGETLISSNGQTMPLNLNASTAAAMLGQSGFQMINSKELNLMAVANSVGGKNGMRTAGITHELREISPNTAAAFMINKTNFKDGKIEIKSSVTSNSPPHHHGISNASITSTTMPNIGNGGSNNNKMLDHTSIEPPTKFIKLINGNAIALSSAMEASQSKDNGPIGAKGLHSGQLTLQQVVGNGGLIMNPIQLLTPQNMRVIGQSNGLATIELSSSPNLSQSIHHRSNSQGHQLITTPMTTVSGPQLHKLLVSGTTTTANGSSSHMMQGAQQLNAGGGVVFTSELARLPGGAELNILPAGTNGATTTIYRGGSGLAILNNGGIALKGAADSTTNRQVHITPLQNNSHLSGLTPIVVSQGGGTTTANLAQILAAASSSSAQQGTKVVSTPLSMVPMVVAVATSNNGNKGGNNTSFNHHHHLFSQQQQQQAQHYAGSAVNSIVVSSSSSSSKSPS